MTIEQQLIDTFLYDPNTGVLRWKRREGQPEAGSINTEGYIDVTFKGKKYRAHRVAWLITYGKWPDNSVDHINQVKADNRLINLRDVTQAENNRNMQRWSEGRWISRFNTSGCTGVYFRKDRQRWRARIKINSVYRCLGCYATKEEAVAARREAERCYR